MFITSNLSRPSRPGVALSLAPVLLLLGALAVIIATAGAYAVQDYSPYVLLGVAAVALALTRLFTRRDKRLIAMGLAKSARQILPAIPVLILIAILSTTWMLSGVVPLLISYGLGAISPTWFLVITCAVCAVVSVLTGSSWTTIATIGTAFLGIGTIMGYNEAWVAGAIISGAYFGDKVSPLSDTTVLAASSCGLDLFRHIRFLMYTSIPAMAAALAVFAVLGLTADTADNAGAASMRTALASTFNLSPMLLIVPAITVILTVLRVPSAWTLAAGGFAGLAAMFIFQPEVVSLIAGDNTAVITGLSVIAGGASLSTGNASLDSLASTGGIAGMMPTIFLVICAMVFGGIMIGTGMLGAMTRMFTHMLRRPRALVGATVGSGLFLNACTGDQYLSIIIGGNIYRSTYRRRGLANEMLSRSLEDSISVTSVLIPWNSCGMTQSGVLGVATLAYLPFCVFNWMSPLLSVLFAWIGFKVRHNEQTFGVTQTLSLDKKAY